MLCSNWQLFAAEKGRDFFDKIALVSHPSSSRRPYIQNSSENKNWSQRVLETKTKTKPETWMCSERRSRFRKNWGKKNKHDQSVLFEKSQRTDKKMSSL